MSHSNHLIWQSRLTGPAFVMFELLVNNILPALFGNSEARKLLRTLLVVQKELDEAEQHTTSVEARLAELHERLEVSAQQNEQLLLEENQQLKNTAEELRQEIEASRGKMVRLEEEFKAELENVSFKNKIANYFFVCILDDCYEYCKTCV
jgi:cytochrome c-type biogenesis protein CcmH/NrfG